MEQNKKNFFLKEQKLSQRKFDEIGLTWQNLDEILSSYLDEIEDLNKAGEYISNDLMKVNNVHSVRFRVKDPEHLVSKIIRKKISSPDRIINAANYKSEITDLIGVRALHLFKNDWIPINEFITKKWNLKEQPIAYVRSGDSKSHIDLFKAYKFIVKAHEFGYRSLHYIASTTPAKNMYFAEIQVRTIFEEGWSEIDHEVRYPNATDNALFAEFLSILNRLAGSADEMGSFIINLKNELSVQQTDFFEVINEKDKKIKELEEKISKLDIKTEEKADMVKMLGVINSITSTGLSGSSQSNLKHPPVNGKRSLLQAYNRYLDKERKPKNR